jgi:hypothetical protein
MISLFCEFEFADAGTRVHRLNKIATFRAGDSRSAIRAAFWLRSLVLTVSVF